MAFEYPTNQLVSGRHIVYDGSSVGVAPGKVALLPGETASFANYSSYHLGLNAIAIDFALDTSGAGLDLTDFRFRTDPQDLRDRLQELDEEMARFHSEIEAWMRDFESAPP